MDMQELVLGIRRRARPSSSSARARPSRPPGGLGCPVLFVVVRFRPGLPEISRAQPRLPAVPERGLPLGETTRRRRSHAALGRRVRGAGRGQAAGRRLLGQRPGRPAAGGRGGPPGACGVATSGVVLSTLRLAADLDYRLTVLADCCADRDAEVHRRPRSSASSRPRPTCGRPPSGPRPAAGRREGARSGDGQLPHLGEPDVVARTGRGTRSRSRRAAPRAARRTRRRGR